jgi:hypothetical protein
MRIGVDARWLKYYFTGIGKLTSGWLSALTAIDHINNYILFVNNDFNVSDIPALQLAEAGNFKIVSLRRNGSSAVPVQIQMLIQDQMTLPWAIRAHDCQ